jgi:DNA-directed RNA polymerase specialized sigma24 family protein
MPAPGSITALLERLESGNHEAADLLWRRYFPRLVNLARKKLRGSSCRVADEEDAALSALDSFCRRAEQGQFPDLKDRDGLWALLAVITARKAANLVRFETRPRRGGGQVQGDSALGDGDSADGDGFDGLAGNDPLPEEAALLADEVDALLKRLPDRELRQMAVRKLQGATNAEIADEQRCSVPTVERRLGIIRRHFKES